MRRQQEQEQGQRRERRQLELCRIELSATLKEFKSNRTYIYIYETEA